MTGRVTLVLQLIEFAGFAGMCCLSEVMTGTLVAYSFIVLLKGLDLSMSKYVNDRTACKPHDVLVSSLCCI